MAKENISLFTACWLAGSVLYCRAERCGGKGRFRGYQHRNIQCFIKLKIFRGYFYIDNILPNSCSVYHSASC